MPTAHRRLSLSGSTPTEQVAEETANAFAGLDQRQPDPNAPACGVRQPGDVVLAPGQPLPAGFVACPACGADPKARPNV